jgi:hypothetical protein
MLLTPYFSESNGIVSIGSEQASRFAKNIGNDFNPIHNPGAKRFCIPGDLLFSMVLSKFGLSQSMQFRFTGMVGDNAQLTFETEDDNHLVIVDNQGKRIVEIERSGEITHSRDVVELFIRSYVGFSGQNFPSLLLPLMAKHQVMFNPARPLVMYDSMSFTLKNLDFTALQLDMSESLLDVQGKRAEQQIHFVMKQGDVHIGHGLKKLVLGGLKPYDEPAILDFTQGYHAGRDAYLAAQ